eukprot:Clim_evm25s149 gene=Clim_evmTU25s149
MDELVPQMEQLLREYLNPATVNEATNKLQGLFKRDLNAVGAAGKILAEHSDDAVKQTAAIVTRKRLDKTWKRLGSEQRTYLRNLYLQSAFRDNSRVVRKAAADLVSAVARVDYITPVDNEGVGQILGAVQQGLANGSVHEKESAMDILSLIIGHSGEELHGYFAQLYGMLDATLQARESTELVANTLVCLGSMSPYFEQDDVKPVQNMWPTVVHATAYVIQQGHDQVATAMEYFVDAITSELPLVTPHIQMITEFLIQLIESDDVEDETAKMKSLLCLQWIAQKRKVVLKMGMLQPMLRCTFKVLGMEIDEPNPDSLIARSQRQDQDEEGPDDEAESVEMRHYAREVIESLAKNMPADKFMPTLCTFASESINSPNYHFHRAAMDGIRASVYGCSAWVSEHLPEIMPWVGIGLNSGKQSVREAAVMCLAELSEKCSPEILDYADQIIPVLFQLIDDPSSNVKLKSLYALDCFCDGLKEKIVPYLQGLMNKLSQVFQATHHPDVLELAMLAISSVAESAASAFTAYFEPVVKAMQDILQSEKYDEKVKGYAIQCVGRIAKAVGREKFNPHIDPFMQFGVAVANQTEEADVRISAYNLFTEIATVMGPDFQHYFNTIMPLILKSATQAPPMEQLLAAAQEAVQNEDDIDNVEDLLVNAIKSDDIYEKEIAIDTLGVFAQHCGAPFFPYMQETVNALMENMAEVWGDVKVSSFRTLTRYVIAIHQGYAPGVKYPKGFPPQYQPEPNSHQLARQVIPALYDVIINEEEIVDVMNAVECVREIIEECGIAVVAEDITTLQDIIRSVMTSQTTCQKMNRDDDEVEEDEEEKAEYEASLIEFTFELVECLATQMGAAFLQHFSQALDLVARQYRQNNEGVERKLVPATFSEIIKQLDVAYEQVSSKYMDMLMSALDDDEDDVHHDAVFAIGLAYRNGGSHIRAKYGAPLLDKLRGLAQKAQGSSRAALSDNVAGALGRMLQYPTEYPADQVIALLLHLLPLREDFDEGEPIAVGLLTCLQAGVAVGPEVKTQLRTIGQMAAEEKIKLAPEVMTALQQACQ